MYVYYPSCNFTKRFAHTSQRVKSYLSTQADVQVAGCCHVTNGVPCADDTIVTVCMSCMHILMEVRPDCKHISLYELLLTRDDFAWPNLADRTFVLQDCFRARGCHKLHEAVRACLARTGAQVVELAENRDQADFDGSFLLHDPYPQNMREAPHYFAEYLPQHVTPRPRDEWPEVYRKQVERYGGLPMVGYCNTCVSGAREGGAEGYHLAELLFADA